MHSGRGFNSRHLHKQINLLFVVVETGLRPVSTTRKNDTYILVVETQYIVSQAFVNGFQIEVYYNQYSCCVR